MQRHQGQADMGVCFDGKERPILGSSQQSFRPWLPKLLTLGPLPSKELLAEQEHSKSWSLACPYRPWNQHHPGVPLGTLARAGAHCQSDCRASCPHGIRQHCSPHRLAVSCPPPTHSHSAQSAAAAPPPPAWLVGGGSGLCPHPVLCWLPSPPCHLPYPHSPNSSSRNSTSGFLCYSPECHHRVQPNLGSS